MLDTVYHFVSASKLSSQNILGGKNNVLKNPNAQKFNECQMGYHLTAVNGRWAA